MLLTYLSRKAPFKTIDVLSLPAIWLSFITEPEIINTLIHLPPDQTPNDAQYELHEFEYRFKWRAKFQNSSGWMALGAYHRLFQELIPVFRKMKPALRIE